MSRSPSRDRARRSAWYSPVSALKNVVLPAPLGPIRLTIALGGMAKATSLTATRPPNLTVMCSACSTWHRVDPSRSLAGSRRRSVGIRAAGVPPVEQRLGHRRPRADRPPAVAALPKPRLGVRTSSARRPRSRPRPPMSGPATRPRSGSGRQQSLVRARGAGPRAGTASSARGAGRRSGSCSDGKCAMSVPNSVVDRARRPASARCS